MIMIIKLNKSVNYLKRSAILIIMSFAFFSIYSNNAFSFVQNDSLNNDFAKDSAIALKDSIIKKIDSIKIYPSKAHGKRLSVAQAQIEISKSDYQFIPYNSFSDILEFKNIGSRISLGGIGLSEGISIFGSNPSSISASFNARDINDLNYAGYNLNYVALDFIENVEIFYGSDAAILSDNGAGIYVNIQEAKYNTARPFSRIWFAQGSYDYLASEAVFSQNLQKDLNFSFGFRRQTSKGRFDNQEVDSWNLRGLLRYNPNNFQSISLVENFYNYKTGDNGGVLWDTNSYFDELSTNVNYSNIYSRNFRHDLTLSYSNIFDSTETNSLSINAYLTNSIWERSEYNLSFYDSLTTKNSYESTLLGINSSLKSKILDPIHLNIGASLDYFNLAQMNFLDSKSDLKYSIYGQSKIFFADEFALKGGIRITNFKDINLLNLGAGLDYQISKNIYFNADLSRIDNFPLFLPKSKFDIEHHNLLISSIKIKNNQDEYKLRGYLRLVQNEIISYPKIDTNMRIIGINNFDEDKTNYYGIDFSAQNWIKDSIISLNSKLAFESGTDKYRKAPLASLSLSPEYILKVGRSVLRAGMQIKLQYDAPIIGYYPFTKSYFFTDNISPNKDKFSNKIDVYAVAKLGNAYVRVTMKNLLSSEYYSTAVYPELDRELRISVSWSFFD